MKTYISIASSIRKFKSDSKSGLEAEFCWEKGKVQKSCYSTPPLFVLICGNSNSNCPQDSLTSIFSIQIKAPMPLVLALGPGPLVAPTADVNWCPFTFLVRGPAQPPVLSDIPSRLPIQSATSRLNSPAFVQGRWLPCQSAG